MSENVSEVANLLRRIELEYEAAHQALHGLTAGIAIHAFITTRQENIGIYHEQLQQLVGPEEAIKLVANTIWTQEDRGTQQA